MADRRTLPIPIPGSELQRMQQALARRYGSEVWDHDGHRILVIRTPSDDPDIVNDLERAVEFLFPSDIKDLDRCLLVGDKRTTAVSVAPLARLMEERLQHDERMSQVLRGKIQGRHGHALHRDTDRLDRMVRLGIRIARPHAQDIDDEDLDLLAEDLVPRLQVPPYNEVRAVHLLADEDHVRLDPDLLFTELRRRHDDDSAALRRRQQEEAERAQRDADRRRQREEIAAVLRRRYDDVPVPSPSWERDTSPSVGSVRLTEREALDPRRSEVDAIRPRLAPRDAIDDLRPTRGVAGQAVMERVSTEALVEAAERTLRAAGYETLREPPVEGHAVHLAAERDDAPARVIVQVAPHMAMAQADTILSACRSLQVDLGLLVAPTADEDAKERLVATKAKWVDPDALATLRL